jgi:hypothetical protein
MAAAEAGLVSLGDMDDMDEGWYEDYDSLPVFEPPCAAGESKESILAHSQ